MDLPNRTEAAGVQTIGWHMGKVVSYRYAADDRTGPPVFVDDDRISVLYRVQDGSRVYQCGECGRKFPNKGRERMIPALHRHTIRLHG